MEDSTILDKETSEEPLLNKDNNAMTSKPSEKAKRRRSKAEEDGKEDDNCAEDNEKKLFARNTEDDRMLDIRVCIKKQRTFALMCYWLYISFTFYFDVIVLIGAVYYIDVCLDANAIWIFYSQGDYKYVGINVGAILLANLWAAIDMFQAVPVEEKYWPSQIGLGGSILIVGYLIPCFLHIAFLVCVSLSIGKKHPLLLCAKLAESVLEASISSIVQVYALMFSTGYDWSAWYQISLSACSSFLSIGYAFTCFDRQDIGLNGIPGKVKGVSFTLFLVYVFRCAEVASRISSLALFCIATRHHIHIPQFMQLPEPFDIVMDYFMITGAPLLILIDLLVLFVLTGIYQWRNPANLRFVLPSFLCFMNPILEKGNPVTVPVYVYYTWRWFELLAMAGSSLYFEGSLDKLLDILHNDEQDFIISLFCAITTAMWTLILPFIRCTQAQHVLYFYTTDMLSEKEFNKSQESLRDNILRLAQGRGSGNSYSLIVSESDESVLTESTMLAERFQKKSREFLTEAVKRLKDVSESSQQAVKEKKNKKANARGVSDTSKKEPPRCTGRLYDWAGKLLVEYEQKKRQREKIDEIFARVLCLSANIIPHRPKPSAAHWESSVGKREHANVLKQLHISLASDRAGTLQQKALEYMTMFREKLLPSWEQWDDSDADRELYRLKCQILHIMGKKGWETKAHGFTREAKKLHACLDARPRDKLPKMKLPNEESCVPEQMKVLVSLWHCVPDKANHEGLHELFSVKEFCAMSDGAKMQIQKLKDDQKALVDSDDLPSYCATFEQAIGDLEHLDLLPEGSKSAAVAKQAFEEIKKDMVNSIEQKIDEYAKAFEVLFEQGEDNNDKTKLEKDMTKALTALKDFEKKLNRPDKNTGKPRFAWCEDVITKCKDKISKAEKSIVAFKEEAEAERLRKEEELKEREAEIEAREEETAQLENEVEAREDELEEATQRNEELERELKEKCSAEAMLKRIARKEKQLQKMKEKSLKQKLRRVKVQKSNGLVIAVSCNSDIDAFADFVEDDGQALVQHVADWLHVPEEAVHCEDGCRIDGSLVVDILFPDAESEVWLSLEKHMQDAKDLRNSYGLTVRVTEIQKDSETFTLRFEGDVGQFIQHDDAIREDILEEIAVQVGALDENSPAFEFIDESITISGEMTVFVLVAVHKVLYKQVQESAEEADPLGLPGIVCSVSVEEDEHLEEESDDQSSMGEVSTNTNEFRPKPGRINESIDEEDTVSDIEEG